MANYNLTGARFVRKYDSALATPTYAAQAEAEKIASSLCTVKWTKSSVKTASFPAHEDDANLANRENFDAALFCTGHKGGMHDCHASAACYRFTLPDAAVGITLTELAASVCCDPYNAAGARVAVYTSSDAAVPMECAICRKGSSADETPGAQSRDGNDWISTNTHAEGVAPRQVVTGGWVMGEGRAVIRPTGGLALQKYLFVFVLMENYATARNGYLEGSAYAAPRFAITTSSPVAGWTAGATVDCAGANEPERIGSLLVDDYSAVSTTGGSGNVFDLPLYGHVIDAKICNQSWETTMILFVVTDSEAGSILTPNGIPLIKGLFAYDLVKKTMITVTVEDTYFEESPYGYRATSIDVAYTHGDTNSVYLTVATAPVPMWGSTFIFGHYTNGWELRATFFDACRSPYSCIARQLATPHWRLGASYEVDTAFISSVCVLSNGDILIYADTRLNILRYLKCEGKPTYSIGVYLEINSAYNYKTYWQLVFGAEKINDVEVNGLAMLEITVTADSLDINVHPIKGWLGLDSYAGLSVSGIPKRAQYWNFTNTMQLYLAGEFSTINGIAAHGQAYVIFGLDADDNTLAVKHVFPVETFGAGRIVTASIETAVTQLVDQGQKEYAAPLLGWVVREVIDT